MVALSATTVCATATKGDGLVDDTGAAYLLSIPEPTQIPGDASGDGIVDAADAQALATNWGVSSGATWAMGDFDGDGVVGAKDASIMAANWGYGTGEAGGASVPEPSVFVMLVSLALLAIGRRRTV
jgi:hypothetical protein